MAMSGRSRPPVPSIIAAPNIRRFCPSSEVAATVKERPLKNSQLSIPGRRKTPPREDKKRCNENGKPIHVNATSSKTVMIKASRGLQIIWSCSCVLPSRKKSATHAFASIRGAHAPRVLVSAPSPRRTFQDFIEIKSTSKLGLFASNRRHKPGKSFGPKGTWQSSHNFLAPMFIPSSRWRDAIASTRAACAPLRQHRLVKLVPIVKIVQVHRVFW